MFNSLTICERDPFQADIYGINSWTKSSIRHVEHHVVTFRVRRNLAIRQRSNSSQHLPELDESCISSMRCAFHTLHMFRRVTCLFDVFSTSFRRLACSAKLCVFLTHRAYSSCSFLTRRAYLFDASCIPLRRVVRTSSTHRAYLGLFDATRSSSTRRVATCSSSTRRVALQRDV